MAVTQHEIDMLECPVSGCDGKLVSTSAGLACCEKALENGWLEDHSRAVQVPRRRLNRIREVAALPVATREKKDAIYSCQGKTCGRPQVGGHHWPGEFVARTAFKPGEWTVIRLVPISEERSTPWDTP